MHNAQPNHPQKAETGASQSKQPPDRSTQLLAGLARASQLLWTTSDLGLALQQVIAVFGEELAIDRVRIFQLSNHSDSGEPTIVLRQEWNQWNGVENIDLNPVQDIILHPDLVDLYQTLIAGKPYQANAISLPDPSRTLLFGPGNIEILALPVFVENILVGENTLWGMLLFEAYQSPWEWTPSFISILQVASSSIGGAISRLRTEDALKESEYRFRTILNSIQAGVIIIQADTRVIVALNQSAQQLIGLNYEDVIGKDIETFIPNTNPQNPMVNLDTAENQEGTLLTGSGERIPILRKPVFLTIDRINYIVETFLSIAERKNAERVMNEQRIVAEAMRDFTNAINQSLLLSEVLDTILSNVDKVVPNDAANIMLIEGDSTRVVACRGYEIRGGNSRVMLMVRSMIDVPNFKKMFETGQPIVVSDTDQAPDWIHFTTSSWIKSYASAPICRNGKTIGFINLNSQYAGFYSPSHADRLLSFCDQAAIAIENARLYENAQKEIEDRKKAEEALQQANNLLEDRVEQRTSELRNANQQLTLELSRRIRAEKSLEDERVLLAKRVDERTAELSTANAQLARDARLKDAFIASMSHELRTPLNTILNISETLQEQVYGEINPAQLKSLRRIEDSGRHLLALINDILDLSKIGAGKLDLIWDYVAVEGLCRSSLQFIEEAAKKKNMQVLLELDPSVHYVWADQRRLKQILVNLLSNAVKFTPQDGKVTLSVHGDPDRKQMCFSVADTGIGIPPERMELLFKPFVQLDNSLARQYEGTGLGLAMVYSLIDLHGGGIRVISEEGKGSQFIVTLNWEDPDKGDRVRSSDSSVASKDPSAQKFTLVTNRISSVLRDYGLDLNTVWLDNQYTNRLASIAPEIIGLDLENIRDSALVINHVLQDTRTAKIPLVITGPAGQKDTIQNLPEHVVFVPSPFDLIELINAIRRISIRGTGGLNRRFALLRERIQPPNTNQLKILIADDNETSGRTLSDYLSSRGHQVTIAYNGMEAIDRTREIRPDLILMDIQMPGMDGLEAIRRIREDKNFSQVPIIAITALAMTDDRNRCLAAGATDYLSKPLSIKELNEFVESHITRKAD